MNWKEENNQLIKEFKFKNQENLACFFLKIAKYSDEKDHHANAEIFNCNTLRFVLFSHTSKIITQSDYLLADAIDKIYNDFTVELK